MLNGLRKFIERGRKGYCYEDLWNFDNWLSRLIANGLREFKTNCHTYPNDIDEWDDWMKILDEMVECFDEQTRGIDNLPHGENFISTYNKRMEHKKKKLHRGFELLERYWWDLWD